jgi:hypothetical protein
MDTASTALLAALTCVLVLHVGCTEAQQAALNTPYDSSADCEKHTLAALTQSAAFNASGYTLSITWQSSFDPVWQSLSCLNALTSMSITGPLPQLPDSWSTNGSFMALQSLDLAGGNLSGMLAASCYIHSVPCLTYVIMTSTSHSIQLAFATCLLCWAAALACSAGCMTSARLQIVMNSHKWLRSFKHAEDAPTKSTPLVVCRNPASQLGFKGGLSGPKVPGLAA